MKKNVLVLLLLVLAALNVSAQAPKYVLFEHFTNTRCGVCGGTNPTFYQNIAINTNPKLHHIAIHPSIPYPACVLYQANTAPQDARASFYGLPGTPRVAINGANTVSAGSVTATNVDNAYCATCSPVEVRVTETTNANATRTATIKVRSVGTPPSGSFKLYAAVVEKNLYYNAPNSETVHHNVFRQFLTASSGDAVTLATQGNETTATLNYSVNAAWVASEIYVLAWLQNETTREVVNSGTKFDAAVIPIELGQWSGQSVGADNRLTWTTLTEIKTDYFDIERGDDGKNFASIGHQKAAGDSKSLRSYSFLDKNVAQGTPQYYRLKTVDLDGSTSFSGIISIDKTDKNDTPFQVFPNPAKGILHYKIGENNTKTAELTLIDILGRVVLTQKLGNTEGAFSVGHLASGTYIVRVETAEKQVFSKVNIE